MPAATMSPRTHRLLHGPIVATLLRLAAPNVVVMVVQALVTVSDAYFVSWLGTEAIAGVALVFPVLMLMQTMSSGGIGNGVSSAIARALGGGRRAEADTLALHALVIALALGGAFTLVLLAGGPVLYRTLGGHGAALAATLAYSNVVFSGALVIWLMNTLANVARGTGHMAVPAVATLGGAPILLLLSPALITGWGPFPRLGVAGAGVSVICYYTAGTLLLLAYFLSGRGIVRLRRTRLRWAPVREILRVGGAGAVNTIQANLSIVMMTGLVGTFGTEALAAYGIGSRLEYLLIPLVFGFGAALLAMVGTNVGAGQRERAERVAWVGAGLACALAEAVGLFVTLVPRAWLGLFTHDPAVVAVGTRYLRLVGPVYGFFGLGLALYFASQGAGRVVWPLVAGFARLAVAVGGGWVALRLGGGQPALFAMVAVGTVVFGLTNATAIRAGAWRR